LSKTWTWRGGWSPIHHKKRYPPRRTRPMARRLLCAFAGHRGAADDIHLF
jgi:hypothetical protein